MSALRYFKILFLKNVIWWFCGCALFVPTFRLPLVVQSRGYSPVVVHGLLIVVILLLCSMDSRVCELHELLHMDSVVVACGLQSTRSVTVMLGSVVP